jgi:hypothetical protein
MADKSRAAAVAHRRKAKPAGSANDGAATELDRYLEDIGARIAATQQAMDELLSRMKVG